VGLEASLAAATKLPIRPPRHVQISAHRCNHEQQIAKTRRRRDIAEQEKKSRSTAAVAPSGQRVQRCQILARTMQGDLPPNYCNRWVTSKLKKPIDLLRSLETQEPAIPENTIAVNNPICFPGVTRR
jgi:hypothetical protein